MSRYCIVKEPLQCCRFRIVIDQYTSSAEGSDVSVMSSNLELRSVVAPSSSPTGSVSTRFFTGSSSSIGVNAMRSFYTSRCFTHISN